MSDGQPNVTAAVVAATLLLLRDDARLGHLIDRPALDAVERAVRQTLPAASWALDRIPWPILKRLALAIERSVSPGFVTHYALRKSMVREQLQRAVDDGYRQVVLLGAGFDMLSASLRGNATVFELDLPATQRAKVHAIDGMRLHPVTYVPIDFARARLSDVLASLRGFEPEADTVFVAEGLLMYLDGPTVEHLLVDLTNDRRRTRAILTFVTPDANGRPRMHSQRRIVDLCMRILGEEFVWGESADGIATRLERNELRVDTLISNAQLYDRLLPGARRRYPTSGEIIVLASHGPRARPSVSQSTYDPLGASR